MAGLGVVAASILLSRLDLGTEALKLCLQISVAMAAGALFLATLSTRRISRDRQQIAESELRFRRAIEDSAIGIVVVGLDGRKERLRPAYRCRR